MIWCVFFCQAETASKNLIHSGGEPPGVTFGRNLRTFRGAFFGIRIFRAATPASGREWAGPGRDPPGEGAWGLDVGSNMKRRKILGIGNFGNMRNAFGQLDFGGPRGGGGHWGVLKSLLYHQWRTDASLTNFFIIKENCRTSLSCFVFSVFSDLHMSGSFGLSFGF